MRLPESLQSLAAHAARVSDTPLNALLAADPARAADFALEGGGLYASFARQRYDRPALDALLALADAAGVPAALRALVDGAKVNASEDRAALHTALRSSGGNGDVARMAHADAAMVRDWMGQMAASLNMVDGITDIIHVGIGGSDLGPRLAVDALREFNRGRFRIHFLGNA